MIRTRESLKRQAKTVLKSTYWKLVLVSLILLVLTAGSSGAASGGTSTGLDHLDSSTYLDEYGIEDDFFEDEFFYDEAIDEEFSYHPSPTELLFGGVSGVFRSIFSFLGMLGSIVAMVILFLLDILVFAPLIVGIHRFFLVNLKFPAQLQELGYAFESNYWTSVKTMFFRDLKLILWTLLFIIPGIVKSYEYRMVPYLLAECPEMSQKDVFAASADLMYGNKWRAFVLDLSFIGWNLLSAVTLGIAGVFFVNPYQNETNAAFYQALCQEKGGRQTQQLP